MIPNRWLHLPLRSDCSPAWLQRSGRNLNPNKPGPCWQIWSEKVKIVQTLKSCDLVRISKLQLHLLCEWPLSGFKYKRAWERRVSALNPWAKNFALNCQGALEGKKKLPPPPNRATARQREPCKDCLHWEHLCRWLKISKPWKKSFKKVTTRTQSKAVTSS